MRVHRGVHKHLEAEADRLIKESFKGTKVVSEKSDVMTYWKWQKRYEREVFVPTGVADPSVRKGIFRRAYNPARPEMNSRDGHVPTPSRTGGLNSFLENN